MYTGQITAPFNCYWRISMTLTKEQFVEREIENMKRDLGLLDRKSVV